MATAQRGLRFAGANSAATGDRSTESQNSGGSTSLPAETVPAWSLASCVGGDRAFLLRSASRTCVQQCSDIETQVRASRLAVRDLGWPMRGESTNN